MSFTRFDIVANISQQVFSNPQPAYNPTSRRLYYDASDGAAHSYLNQVLYNPGRTGVQMLTPTQVGNSEDYGINETNMTGMVINNGTLYGMGIQEDRSVTIDVTSGAATILATVDSDLMNNTNYSLATDGTTFVAAVPNAIDHTIATFRSYDPFTGVSAPIIAFLSTFTELFTYAQDRFWSLTSDHTTLNWFTIDNTGGLDESGTLTFASLGVTFDFTNYGWGGMCGVGNDIILLGEDMSENFVLGKLTGLLSDNSVIMPENYLEYAFWCGVVVTTANVDRVFSIPSLHLRRNGTFTVNDLQFRFRETERKLSLELPNDSFRELYPVILSK